MIIVIILLSIIMLFVGWMALAAARALWVAPDALTRANVLGPLTGIDIPLLVIANLINDWMRDGFDANNFIRAILTITFMLVIASIGSFYLGRAIHGVDVVDQSRDPHETVD